jgi:hypothetical protein
LPDDKNFFSGHTKRRFAMPRGLFRCHSSLSHVLVLLLQALTSADRAHADEPTAESLLRTSHDARALWHGLPGFSADISVSTNGVVAEGRMIVTADGKLQLEDLGSEHFQWAVRRLQSLVDHRMPQEARDHDVSFADDVTTHPLGRLIRIDGDRWHSLYRIAGDVITEVHRTMDTTRFSITVTEVQRNAEGKHLPKTYSVSWWNVDSGALTACEVVRNEWVRVSVRSDGTGQREVGEVRLRNHRLLFQAAQN